MNMIRVKYDGKKPYTDRTPMKNAWLPGDEKLVPEQYARKGAYALLKFAEFSEVASDAQRVEQPQELEQAQAVVAAVEAKAAEESTQVESMLLSIGTWEKDALADYAAKYDTKIDKRLGVQTLREQVGNLVEQFGVR